MGDVVPVKPGTVVPQTLRDVMVWADRIRAREQLKLKEKAFGWRALRRVTLNIDSMDNSADYLNGIVSWIMITGRMAEEMADQGGDITPLFIEGFDALPELMGIMARNGEVWFRELVNLLIYMRRFLYTDRFDETLRRIYGLFLSIADTVGMELQISSVKTG